MRLETTPSSVLRVRAPEPLMAALRAAAERDMRSVSDYARTALLEKVRAAGLEPATQEAARG